MTAHTHAASYVEDPARRQQLSRRAQLLAAASVSYNVIEALATLAWHGRRAAFVREQLLAALKIIDQGDAAPGRLIGWAQRALLRYPAPMLMTAFPPDVVRSTVHEIGGRILAAEADETYGGHWHYTRYYLAPPVGGARGLHATRPQ